MNSNSDQEIRANTRHFKQACRILGAQTKETLGDVYIAMAFVRGTKRGKFPTTVMKPQKKAARSFEQALHKLEVVLKNPHLAHDVRDGFPDLKPWRERAAEAASRKLHFVVRPKSDTKLLAATQAAHLLIAHNIPLTLTRKGSWCQMAALLYGEPKADFLHHCREAKANLQAKADLERDFPLADLIRDADNPD